MILLVRKPVGTKSVVVEVTEVDPRLIRVIDDHAAFNESCDLLIYGGRGLLEAGLHHSAPKK